MTLHDRLASIYAHSTASVPVGFIHNDITPSNLLIDTAGEVTALLDFDDSTQTHLAYELGAIIGAFGRDRDQRADPHRAYALVAAYDSVRPLEEVVLLPDSLAVRAAAEGISVLASWLSSSRRIVDPLESFSIQEFLDIANDRQGLRGALTFR